MTSRVCYNGGLRTTATHLLSGTVIETDAPLDNNGQGQRFSPTDLLATALGSCMLTIMGILADRNNWNLEGTDCEVEKIMLADPRRVGTVNMSVSFPPTSPTNQKDRKMLEQAALNCPVFKSIHPDLITNVSFNWPPDQL